MCGAGRPSTLSSCWHERKPRHVSSANHRLRRRGRHLGRPTIRGSGLGPEYRACGGVCTVERERPTVRTTRGSTHLQCLRPMRPAVVPSFGHEGRARLGHERVPHVPFRPERSVERPVQDLGQPPGPAAASAAAVHPVHQLLAWVDASVALTDRGKGEKIGMGAWLRGGDESYSETTDHDGFSARYRHIP